MTCFDRNHDVGIGNPGGRWGIICAGIFLRENGCFSAEEKKSEVPAARLCSKPNIFR